MRPAATGVNFRYFHDCVEPYPRQIYHRANPKAQGGVQTEYARAATYIGSTGTACHLVSLHTALPLHNTRRDVRALDLAAGPEAARSAECSCTHDHYCGTAVSVLELGWGLESLPRPGVATLVLLSP